MIHSILIENVSNFRATDNVRLVDKCWKLDNIVVFVVSPMLDFKETRGLRPIEGRWLSHKKSNPRDANFYPFLFPQPNQKR